MGDRGRKMREAGRLAAAWAAVLLLCRAEPALGASLYGPAGGKPSAVLQLESGRRLRHPGIHTAMVTPYDEILVQRICAERGDEEIHIAVSLKTRSLYLCCGEQVAAVFIAQVGSESAAGGKERQGDNRTPRGEYYVCLKNENSQYYKALGLSYPSVKDAGRGYGSGLITAEERDRIVEAIAAGEQPDWGTALGGAIEIHGEKGGPTAGCIAVGNPAMDALWPVVELGCRVRIF